MLVNIGFLGTDNNIFIKSLNYTTQLVDNKVITSEEIADQELSLLFFDEQTDFEPYAQLLQKEDKNFPILDIASVNLKQEEFEQLDFENSNEVFLKVLNRWVLTTNMLTIENVCNFTSELKELWTKNRDQFFEKLWFILKRNLGAIDLRIIFHDLKNVTPEQAEKGEKPSLIYSSLQGTKAPVKNSETDIEKKLMQEYEKDFSSKLNITEFNATEGKLVMCVTIDRSPVLMMANLKNFNQLQRSVMNSLFNGLNELKNQSL